MAKFTRRDFDRSPFLVFYEITRSCDLVCRHCRACAQTEPAPDELTSKQSRRLIDDLASFPMPPLLVLTGGDPIKRADVFDMVEYGVARGLEVAMTPSATPLLTTEVIAELQDRGLSRLAVSLDGADSETHDGFRGVSGIFERTFRVLRDASDRGLSLQINTTITRDNMHQIDEIAEQIAEFDIALWSVFFLVPVGRGTELQRLSADECEAAFERLWHHARTQSFGVKTTEAPHYRRFVMQQTKRLKERLSGEGRQNLRAPLGVNDGKGCLFVSHRGEICPSGFLPIVCGRFPESSVVDVYQNAPVFRQLRDADQLKGKCGVCDYRNICGGSRARSLAVAGDMLAAEPDCAYLPEKWES